VSETGGQDDGGGGFLRGRGAHDRRHSWRRHGDNGDVRRARERVIGLDRGNALDPVVVRIDEMDGAGELAAMQIFQDRAAG